MNDDELSELIRQNATRHRASDRLRASVRTQIALHAAAQADNADTRRGWRGFGWRAAMAGFAGGVALALAVVWVAPRMAPQNSLTAEIVADHVHALKSGPLIEVASSDRHTVKPWFQGKLDFAPPVIDLETEGFPLLGGRVERVAGAPVAVLVYGRRKHILNVFVWPAEREQPSHRMQRNGFNVVQWSDGAMQIWVVSDLEAGEIERFGQQWRRRAAAR